MNTKQIRLFAKDCVKDNWSVLAALLLIITAINVVISIFTLGTGALVIAGPLELGVLAIYCRAINADLGGNESISSIVKELWNAGFTRKKGLEALLASLVISIIVGVIVSVIVFVVWVIVGSMTALAVSNMMHGYYGYYGYETSAGIVFAFLLCILLIIAAIIAILLIYIRLSMTMYILLVEENAKAMYAIRRSSEMVNGNTMRFVKLFISFIGWFVLCGIFFPIVVWVYPYFVTAWTKLKIEIYNNYQPRGYDHSNYAYQNQNPAAFAQQPSKEVNE